MRTNTPVHCSRRSTDPGSHSFYQHQAVAVQLLGKLSIFVSPFFLWSKSYYFVSYYFIHRMSRDYDRRRGGISSNSNKLRMDSNSASQSRSHGNSSSKRKELDNVMRKARESQSNYWNKKLLEVEERDPNRWRHSGYKEMYIGGSSKDKSYPHSPRHRSPRPRSPRVRSPRNSRSPRVRSPHTPRPRTPKSRNSQSPRRRTSRTRNSHTPRPRSPVFRSHSPRPRSPRGRRSYSPHPRSPRTPRERSHNTQTRVVKSPSSESTCSDQSCSVCSSKNHRNIVNASSRSRSASSVQSRTHTKDVASSSSRAAATRPGRPRSPPLPRPFTPPPMPQPPLRQPKEYGKLTKDLKARKKERHVNKVSKDSHIPESVQMVLRFYMCTIIFVIFILYFK